MIDQGLRVFLDVDFFFGFSGFLDVGFSRTIGFGFSLDFHSFIRSFFGQLDFSEPAHQSYLTIQTYNRKTFAAREETLYLKDAVITDAFVDLRYTL